MQAKTRQKARVSTTSSRSRTQYPASSNRTQTTLVRDALGVTLQHRPAVRYRFRSGMAVSMMQTSLATSTHWRREEDCLRNGAAVYGTKKQKKQETYETRIHQKRSVIGRRAKQAVREDIQWSTSTCCTKAAQRFAATGKKACN